MGVKDLFNSQEADLSGIDSKKTKKHLRNNFQYYAGSMISKEVQSATTETYPYFQSRCENCELYYYQIMFNSENAFIQS